MVILPIKHRLKGLVDACKLSPDPRIQILSVFATKIATPISYINSWILIRYTSVSTLIVRIKQLAWPMKKYDWTKMNDDSTKNIVSNNKRLLRTYDTLTPLGRFPSMASFLSRQSAQRKGPCQGFELVEKMEPAWTEMPSLGARSTWHTAQTKRPDVDCPVLSSLPSLQYVLWLLDTAEDDLLLLVTKCKFTWCVSVGNWRQELNSYTFKSTIFPLGIIAYASAQTNLMSLALVQIQKWRCTIVLTT